MRHNACILIQNTLAKCLLFFSGMIKSRPARYDLDSKFFKRIANNDLCTSHLCSFLVYKVRKQLKHSDSCYCISKLQVKPTRWQVTKCSPSVHDIKAYLYLLVEKFYICRAAQTFQLQELRIEKTERTGKRTNFIES